MARDNRTLKLSILADIDDLKKKLDQADDTVQKSSSKMGDFSKKAVLAFAAAGVAAAGYATKLAIDGVKAAIEDEAAQLRLANALKAATGATDAQIKATEDMILKTSLATGVADDQLRPALQRLAVSTKDTVEAQNLLNLALDISKATGKDLESVANALGRAQDGNTTSLGRLGLGLSKAEIATLSFTEIQTKLSDLYGGAAAANAETFQGKIDRLKVGFDEAKESLGVALLPQVEKFIGYLNETGIPALNGFIAGLTGDEGLINSLDQTGAKFVGFGKFVSGAIGILQGFITFLREAVGLVVELANTFVRAYNIINPGTDVRYIPNPAPSDGYLRNPVPSVPSSTGLDRNPSARAGVTNNITVKAVDSEGAARAVAKVLTTSSARSIPALDGASIRRFQ
jgi:hypothetical protein